MKKRTFTILSVLLLMMLSFSVMISGCFGISCNKDEEDDDPVDSNGNPKTYTIQYADDSGVYQINVANGMPYYIETIPYKFGYEFLGLFSQETGGVQYVGANGSSLTIYTEKENKVLFPQFKPISFTVILEYEGATTTGDRSLSVAYDSNLPELPKNLVRDNYNFAGWYTEPDCTGLQVCDVNGNIPGVSILNKYNFKLDEKTRRITLYAGFKPAK